MSVELGNDPDRLAKRWVLIPRVLFEVLGDVIREVVGDAETQEIDRETAGRLLRLAVSWESVKREAR